MKDLILSALFIWVLPILVTVICSVFTGFLGNLISIAGNVLVVYGVFLLYKSFKDYYGSDEKSVSILCMAFILSCVRVICVLLRIDIYNILDLCVFILIFIAFSNVLEKMHNEKLSDTWKVVGILEIACFVCAYISFLSYVGLILRIFQLLMILKFISDFDKSVK